MKRFHVHVAVDDLKQSIGFYSVLFATDLSIIKTDYAKWMLDDPRVNFAISTRGRQAGLDHLGIQADNGDELKEIYSRLHKAGANITKSKKSWIEDPSGISWETFHTTGEGTDYGDGSGERVARVAHENAVGDQAYNVLFLSNGNSVRSIFAEAILNKVGAGKFRAYSTGSQPKERVHPEAIRLLQSLGYDTSSFRSKSCNEFTKPGAPQFDFAFTVYDNTADEVFPVWPGQPMTAHWGVPNPTEAMGTPAEIALAFRDTYRMLHQRISIFTALPLCSLDQMSLQKKLDEIGRMKDATAKAADPA